MARRDYQRAASVDGGDFPINQQGRIPVIAGTRVRPYTVPVGGDPMLAGMVGANQQAPAAPPASALPAVPAAPAPRHPLGWSSNFQRSVSNPRSLTALRAGTYAEQRSQQPGAASDPERQAAMRAYSATQMAKADMAAADAGNGPNFHQGRGLAADENTRQNVTTDAQAGLMGEQGGYLHAQGNLANSQAQYLPPAQAAAMYGQGHQAHAAAGMSEQQALTESAMRPVMQAQGQFAVDRGRAMLPYDQANAGATAEQGRATAEQGRATAEATRAQAQQLPVIAGGQADLAHGQAEQARAQGQAANAAAAMPPVDPIDAIQKRYDLATKMAHDQDTFRFGFGTDENQLRDQAFQSLGGTGNNVPNPNAAPAPSNAGIVRVKSPADAKKLPKGTRFMAPDGVIRIVP